MTNSSCALQGGCPTDYFAISFATLFFFLYVLRFLSRKIVSLSSALETTVICLICGCFWLDLVKSMIFAIGDLDGLCWGLCLNYHELSALIAVFQSGFLGSSFYHLWFTRFRVVKAVDSGFLLFKLLLASTFCWLLWLVIAFLFQIFLD